MCTKVETKALGVRTANSDGREAGGEAAAFCLESLRRCLEEVCFPEEQGITAYNFSGISYCLSCTKRELGFLEMTVCSQGC